MEQQPDVQTVFIKDLFFLALHQWRKILISALVCGLLFAALAFIIPEKNVNAEEAKLTNEKIQWHEQLIDDSNARIQEQMTYLKESPLMQIDPYNSYSAGVHMFIVPIDATATVNEDQIYNTTPAILQFYQSNLTSPQTIDPLAKELEMDSRYLRELISFDNYGTSLAVTVHGSSIPEAQKIVDLLRNYIEDLQPEACQRIEEHTIDFHDFNIGPRLNSSLYEQQNGARKRITGLQETITNATNTIKTLETSLEVPGQMSPVLLVVLGVAIGVCIVVGITWAGHISCKKVYSARVLKNVTGVRTLCTIAGPKKRFILDRWLRKMEGRALNADQLPAVAAALKNQCTGKLLVIGQSTDAQREPILHALKGAGIEYSSHEKLLDDAKTIQDLQNCTAVVLAETCGLSTYEQIRFVLEYANDAKKPLLGCILIDG